MESQGLSRKLSLTDASGEYWAFVAPSVTVMAPDDPREEGVDNPDSARPPWQERRGVIAG